MKSNIHPQYLPATVKCACGNTWETRAVRPKMRVETCSLCHPFFTGEKRIVDAAGRLERFKRRYGMN
jgi:large subunit ribosomal protein L31